MNEMEVKEPVVQQNSNGAAAQRPIGAANQSTRTPSDDLEQQLRADKAGALVMAARRAHRKDQKTQAQKLLKEAFLIDPHDCGGLELLGDMFMEDGEQEKALKIFERGRQHHPSHRAFEEKIGICHVDLDEMRRDRDRRAQILERGGIEKWMLLSAPKAFGLSAMLPGAGQAYVGQGTRAYTLFGIAVFTFLGWSVPLYYGMKTASANGVKGLGNGISAALGSMGGLGLTWFWLMVAAWVGIYTYAAIDAMVQAEQVNDLRKQGWEVPEE